jgi:hypothetical protein
LQIGFARILHPMAQLGDLLLGRRDFAHMPDNLLPPDGNDLELLCEFELPALRGRKRADDGGVIVSFPEPEFSCLFARARKSKAKFAQARWQGGKDLGRSLQASVQSDVFPEIAGQCPSSSGPSEPGGATAGGCLTGSTVWS